MGRSMRAVGVDVEEAEEAVCEEDSCGKNSSFKWVSKLFKMQMGGEDGAGVGLALEGKTT